MICPVHQREDAHGCVDCRDIETMRTATSRAYWDLVDVLAQRFGREVYQVPVDELPAWLKAKL